MNTNKKMVWLTVGVLVLGLALGFVGASAWNRHQGAAANSVSAVNQAQVKDLLNKVSQLVILPGGEDPVVATINDADALIKQQAFYKGAMNGDVVIVYQKAAKAIVYSPSRNIIVNIGPVVLQDQTAATNTPVATSTSTKK